MTLLRHRVPASAKATARSRRSASREGGKRCPTIVTVGVALVASLSAQAPAPADALFEKFFAAESPADALVVADQIAASGVAFDAAYARLKKGRTYFDEKRGEYSLRWRSKSGPFFNNVVDVPGDYDPSKPLQLRVQLHGGVGRPSPNAVAPGRPTGGAAPNRIAGEQQIYLHPSGWAAAQWWDEEQIDNILRAVDTLKRNYNIDESRVYLTGISDGGTGVYYMALKEERESFEKFVREHPRVAHPAKLSWETERVDKFNRHRWLVINELRTEEDSRNSPLKDMGFFPHTRRSGRVDIVRTANAFDARTRGVGAFTVLLSPDAIDFSKPIAVTVNGKPAFSGRVKPDPAVLLSWSARDNDRTALYGAELRIVP